MNLITKRPWISAAILLLTALLGSGCSTTDRHEMEHQVVTRIESNPPGARIEVNGEIIGAAPVETRIRHHPSDQVVMGRVVIRALPVNSGHYVQLRELHGPEYPFDPRRDVVPEQIVFNMTREPLNGVAARGAGPEGTYIGVGQSRWVNQTIEGGVFVELDDRSIWQISASDRTKTSLWSAGEAVEVREGENPEFPYVLVGQRNLAEARFIPR